MLERVHAVIQEHGFIFREVLWFPNSFFFSPDRDPCCTSNHISINASVYTDLLFTKLIPDITYTKKKKKNNGEKKQ